MFDYHFALNEYIRHTNARVGASLQHATNHANHAYKIRSGSGGWVVSSYLRSLVLLIGVDDAILFKGALALLVTSLVPSCYLEFFANQS